MISGKPIDRLKLQQPKLQSDPSKCALQLMSCLFSSEELSTYNPSGLTKSSIESHRGQTIGKLDPSRMRYIRSQLLLYMERYLHDYYVHVCRLR